MRNICTLALTLLLCSCFNSKLDSPDQKISYKESKPISQVSNIKMNPPSWYTDATYSDTNDYLYGYGSSDTTKKAINNALADMASNLETTISTQTSININADNESLNKKLSEDITSSSKKVIFIGYKVINQKRTDHITYVLISIHIPTLISQLKQTIIKKHHSTDINQPNSDIDTFRFTQELYSNTIYIKNAIETLELVDRGANLDKYNQIYNDQLHELNTISRQISIYFEQAKYPNFLYPPLKEFLQKIFVTTNRKSNANIYIKITNNKFDEHTDELGNYIVNASIKVTIKNTETNKIITKNFDVDAKSGFGRYDTISKLKQNFADELTQSHGFLDQTSL